MSYSAKKLSRSEETIHLTLRLAEIMRADLREFVCEAGAAALQTLLEQERTVACGSRYMRSAGRKAHRYGHADGELTLGGRRVSVRRPRARSLDGHEVVLPSWAAFSDKDPLNQRAVEQMLVGVSTRRYERSLEPVGEIKTRGMSKVSSTPPPRDAPIWTA